MKLLPAAPAPIDLLPAARNPDRDKEVREWWEDRIAEMDLKELLWEAYCTPILEEIVVAPIMLD